MRIEHDFDGGNIIVHRIEDDHARLGIRHDTKASEFRQWFHFALDGAEGREVTLTIENAGECTYPDAWEGYDVCASYDLDEWFRVPTEYEDGALTWSIEPEEDRVYFAYFAPFSQARHQQLLEQVAASPFARVESIGKSTQGRSMDLVIIGDEDRIARLAEREGQAEGDEDDEDDTLHIWIIARQHPGETMAEWFAEGVLGKLLDEDDETSAELRARCTFYIVPNMCPDGGVAGNLRANAAGENLNRAWTTPSAATTPEVYYVRAAMLETGVDMFLDVHGDERNPWCFLAGCEGNPSYDERIRMLENLFEQALVELDEDFQDEYGYPRDEPGGGDLRTAGNWVGETFNCLAYTVEMPFKDADNNPDREVGWNPERAKRLGASAVEAIAACVDELE